MCCDCCRKPDSNCRKVLAPFDSLVRALENVPIIGHIIASIYACSNSKDKAERAGIKSSMGFCLAICSCPAEIIDEAVRHRSPVLISYKMTPRPDWMKKFSARTIRHLCMPASHQSATYEISRKLEEIPMVEGWSKCQELSIDTQLYSGVRLLDLRVMTYENEVWTHHQKVLCVKLKNILEVIRDFLAEYPSEIVTLYITNDGKHIDWMNVHSLLNEYLGKKLIPEHMRDMRIGDIVEHGKNVIVAGIPNVAYSWRGIDYRWPNKASPNEVAVDFAETRDQLRTYNPYFLYWYKMEATVNTHTIIRSLGGLPSVTVSGYVDEKFDFLEDVAASVNHHLYSLLNQDGLIPFNYISMDFVNDDIIARILALNAAEKCGIGPLHHNELLEGSRANLTMEVRVDSPLLDKSFNYSFRGSNFDGTLDRSSTLNRSLLSNEQIRTEVWESVM